MSHHNLNPFFRKTPLEFQGDFDYPSKFLKTVKLINRKVKSFRICKHCTLGRITVGRSNYLKWADLIGMSKIGMQLVANGYEILEGPCPICKGNYIRTEALCTI